MKTALIIIALIAVSPFVLGLLWAVVSSMLGKTQKRERAEAIVFLSQVPTDVLAALLRIFSAFKLRKVEEANRQGKTPFVLCRLAGGV